MAVVTNQICSQIKIAMSHGYGMIKKIRIVLAQMFVYIDDLKMTFVLACCYMQHALETATYPREHYRADYSTTQNKIYVPN